MHVKVPGLYALFRPEQANMAEVVSVEAWRATFAEFIATLLFVFVGGGSVVISATLTDGELNAARLVAIALAHGLAIALLVYATANLSGGHINPAVTFAATLTRKISVSRGSMYVAAQIAGAVIGALLLKFTLPDVSEGDLGAHGLGTGVTAGMGLTMEIVLTFVLVFVIFSTAIDPQGMGRLAPLAIGLTVLVAHLVAVPFTGASINPARSFGPAVVAGVWADHWVYWVGPLVGAALAGLLYQVFFITRIRADKPRMESAPVHTDRTPSLAGGDFRGVEIFRGLSDEQIDSVVSLGQGLRVSTGEVLGVGNLTGGTGELGEYLFIVIDGRVEVLAESELGETMFRMAGPGESFPLLTAVGARTRITSIVAVSSVELLAILRSSLDTLFSDSPEIGMRMYGAMANVIANRYAETTANLTRAMERTVQGPGFWPF